MTNGKSFVLFDTPERSLLYPFTETRSIAEIRCGILTVKERWELLLGCNTTVLTEEYLQGDYVPRSEGATTFINAAVFPDEPIKAAIKILKPGDRLVHKQTVIAFCTDDKNIYTIQHVQQHVSSNVIDYNNEPFLIKYPWQLTQFNHKAIEADYRWITKDKQSQHISATNRLIAEENIFTEEGATVEHVTINASAGPVYIGKNVTLMEGCLIRGPFAACEGAVLKMGTTIYGATTIGPYCIAGGEIKNAIMMGYSNKAHHGYLGDAVIGEWCNLGAGTSNSNIKNNAADIILKRTDGVPINIGAKCGLMMGDYTRCAINTSFNTATFAGVACNIFGDGLTPKQMAHFTWGYSDKYNFDKALQHIANWKKFKNQLLTQKETHILEHLYKQIQ